MSTGNFYGQTTEAQSELIARAAAILIKRCMEAVVEVRLGVRREEAVRGAIGMAMQAIPKAVAKEGLTANGVEIMVCVGMGVGACAGYMPKPIGETCMAAIVSGINAGFVTTREALHVPEGQTAQ